jgi:hypothetical protein
MSANRCPFCDQTHGRKPERDRAHREVRLPMDHLERVVLAMLGRRGFVPNSSNQDPSRASREEAAALCGVSTRTWQRWRDERTLPWRAADGVAVRLGLHPLNIWPDFNSVVDDLRSVA